MNLVFNMPNIGLLCRLGVVISTVAGHPIERNQVPGSLQHEPYGNDGSGPRWSGNRGLSYVQLYLLSALGPETLTSLPRPKGRASRKTA